MSIDGECRGLDLRGIPDLAAARLKAAIQVCRGAGLALCRLLPGKKVPLYRGWPTFSYDPDLFDDGDNLGVLTGWISDAGLPGHALVCVDLDGEKVLSLADDRLPPTNMADGRHSRPKSRRFYATPSATVPVEETSTADQAVAAARAAGKHPGPRTRHFHKAKLDLLGTGGQAAIPPSLHHSGETREWSGGKMGRPAVVAYPVLLAAVTALARECGWDEAQDRTGAPPSPRPPAPGVPLAGDAKDRLRAARRYVLKARGGEGIPGTRQGEGASSACLCLAGTLVNGFGLEPQDALPVMERWGSRFDQVDEGGGWYPWTRQELQHKLAEAKRLGDPEGRPRGWKLRRLEVPETPAGGRYADWFAEHLPARK